MKTLWFLVIAVLLSCQIAFSQEVQNFDHINGGHFEKRIEYNIFSGLTFVDEKTGAESPCYELHNKTALEKLFFGNTNSPIEYVIEVTDEAERRPEFKGSAGLRLYKKRPDSRNWTLEIVPFADYSIRGDYELAVKAVKAVKAEVNENRYKQYRPKTKIFTLHHIGDRLREEITALIVGFRAEGGRAWIHDGYTATFRSVIGDELWTLTVHMPQNRALQMSNLCRRMIEDAQSGKFDESKYAQMLQVPTDD
jgi:hypothetical protein